MEFKFNNSESGVMKYKILVFMVLLAAFSYPAFAANLPAVLVDTISPYPASPGDDITLKIVLSNDVSEPVTDVPVNLIVSYPFIIKSSEHDVLTGVSICGGCKYTNTYYLTVDSQAVSGAYPIYVKVSKGGAEQTTTISIKITGIPNLVFSTQTDLQHVVPDSTFTVSMDLDNIGSGSAKEIEVSVNSSSIISLGGSTKTIDSIEPKRKGSVVFNLIASESMEAGSYNVPIRIIYLDEKGTTYTTTENMGLRVVNQGDLNVQSITITDSGGSSYLVAGKPIIVIARIENVGHGTADYIEATLECPFNGKTKAFLGQLDKKEDAPAVFNFAPGQSGSFECKITIDFKDDLGEHTTEKTFMITIDNPDMTGLIIGIIVLAIILFVFRKRIMKTLKGK